MRLLKLHLQRYGCFTDCTLTFREQACLHIVYGRNEAGKSTALSAIADLLFGFATKTNYAYNHAASKLSVAAELRDKDGKSFSFQRRKGTKDTLSDLGGNLLPDTALVPYIGSMDKKVFTHAFGLSQETLRAGADEMLHAGGETGASLLAAASGVSGLKLLSKRFHEDAAKIFTPSKSSSRTFYQARDRFEEATKQVRDLELKAPDLRKKREEIEATEEALKAVREERKTNGLRREQLRRQKDLAPLLRAIDADEREVSSWEALPALTTAQVAEMRAALQARIAAQGALEQSVAAEEAATELLESYSIEGALLDHSFRIDALLQQVGNVESMKADLPKIQGEAANYHVKLNDVKRRLGLPETADLETMQPTDAQIANLFGLVQQGRDNDSKLNANAEQIQDVEDSLAQLEEQLKSGPLEDPSIARQSFTQYRNVLNRLPELRRLERVCKSESMAISEKARQLSPPLKDLNALSTVSLPSASEISHFEAQDIRHTQAVSASTERVADRQASLRKLKDSSTSQDATAELGTPERIRELRTQREARWTTIRHAYTGQSPLPPAAEAEAHALLFERAIELADSTADRAVTDAEAIANHENLQKRIAAATEELVEAEAALTQANRHSEQHQQSWKELWSGSAIDPQSPKVMLDWIGEVNRLLERRNKLNADQEEKAQIEQSLLDARPELNVLGSGLGLHNFDQLSWDVAPQAIELELEKREKIWQTTAELLSRQSDARQRLIKLERTRTTLKSSEQQWEAAWSASLSSVHLASSATLEEAEATLKLWQTTPALEDALNNRTRRVRRMQEEVKKFEIEASALLVATGLSDTGVDAVADAKKLASSLKNARDLESKAAVARNQLTEAKQKKALAEKISSAAEQRLRESAKLLPALAPVGEEIEAAEARENVLSRLRQRREILAPLSRGDDEATLRSSLIDFDEDAATVEIESLSLREAQLNAEENQLYADSSARKAALEAQQGGLGAEVALQRRKNAEAELLATGQEWAVKYFGAILLKHAMEDHRKRQQDPFMKRAGELFAKITDGKFTGVEQEFDDNDCAQLVGRRDTDHTVCVPAMSEGTRDQLYLALRLAYLEQYADRSGTLPFIGDDLLTSFDELRTRRGLETLASTGNHIQPILFTHHRHVVELATEALGSSVDVVELPA